MKKLLLLELCLCPWITKAQLTTGNGPYYLGTTTPSQTNTIFALQIFTNDTSKGFIYAVPGGIIISNNTGFIDGQGVFITNGVVAANKFTGPGLNVFGGSSGPITLPISGSYFFAPNNDFTNAAADTSGVTRLTSPAAGTLANLYVTASANPGAVVNSVTIFTNGVATSVTVTLNNVTTANDVTHQVAVLAGTEIGIKIITGAGTAVRWGWGFQLR